tara:strand:+ start:610 stop:876 length:267 start_codon:yes stop_codon:yes gene_type:complete
MAKRKKTKFCKVCNEDILVNEMRNIPMFQDSHRQIYIKEYCEEHEASYFNHTCKPEWCKACGFLTKYIIEVHSKELPGGIKEDKKVSE